MNICVLIGRLTKDPELRYTKTGKGVATFSLAVDRAFTGQDGQKQTDFFNVVVWGKQAEACANYLSKGSQVAVRGSVQNRSYETDKGEKRYITEIIAESVQFLGSPNNAQNQVAPKTSDYKALEDEDVPF